MPENKFRLFCDDIRRAPDDTWHVARTVTEAIRILATMPVDEVSLDHDISHLITMDGCHRPYPCGETFEPVARFIVQQEAFHRETNSELSSGIKVHIHTSNYPGAQKMKEILKEAGMTPIMEVGKYQITNRLELEV